MDIQELAQEYESKSDEELLRLALQREELTREALAALDGELAKRRINDPQTLNTFRQQEQEQKTEADKNPGRLFVLHPYGIGRKRFGKADYHYEQKSPAVFAAGLHQWTTNSFWVAHPSRLC